MQFALPWSLSADVSYVGQHGFNLLQNVDINAVDFGVAFTASAQDPTLPASATPGGDRAIGRPAASVPRVRRDPSRTGASATNTYHSIQTSVNRRFRNGFSLGLNYTLGLSNTGTAGNPVRLEHHPDG